MNKTKFTSDKVCELINRRIYSMDYKKEVEIREYIENNSDDGDFVPYSRDADNIADILGTNENCIADILELNNED